jgi:peptidyl-tRNA hydrolase, PTH2 family
MSETTKAFAAGALLPTIAFLLLWHSNRNITNKAISSTKRVLSDNKNSTPKNNNYDKKETNETINNEHDIDENDVDDDDSSGQLSLDDDDNDNSNKIECKNWGMKNAPYKMVLCVNIDLSMGKGKIAAQCCHAAVGCYKRSMKLCPAAIRAWEYTGCAKIAVKCHTLDEMMLIATKAKSLNIPFYLVEDAGRTQIAAGSKTVLCLFGPVSVFEGITDHLKLM